MGDSVMDALQKRVQELTEEKANWGVLFHRLEQGTIFLQRQTEELQKQAATDRVAKEQSEAKFAQIQTEATRARERNKQIESELAGKIDEVRNLERTKRNLVEANKNLSSEYDRIGGDLSKCQEKVLAFSSQVHTLEVKVAELEAQVAPVNFKLAKLDNENKLLTQQKDYLEKEVREKDAQLLRYRTDAVSEASELNINLVAARDATTQLEAQLRAVQAREKSLQVASEQAREQAVIEANDLNRTILSLERQLATQTKLTQLYQSKCDQERSSNESLETSTLRLKEVMAKETAAWESERLNFNKVLEHKQEHIDQLTKELQEQQERLKVLSKELQDEKDTLRQIAVSGAEGATQPASDNRELVPLPAGGDAGPASVYARYIKAIEAFRQEKKEKLLMESYIKQIQREVAEKAPVIEAQREEYQRMMSSFENMNRKLNKATQVIAELRKANSDQSTEMQMLVQDRNQKEQELVDLSTQVGTLLKVNARMERGMSVPRPMLLDHSSLAADQGGFTLSLGLTEPDIISQHLVPVVSVDDMVAKNQALLRELRASRREVQALTQQLEASKQELQLGNEARQQLLQVDFFHLNVTFCVGWISWSLPPGCYLRMSCRRSRAGSAWR
jgi:chromosome segregation ATPase